MNNDKKMGSFLAPYMPTNCWADRNKNALVDEDLAVEEQHPAPKTLMDYINRHR